ncbi:leucyl aminopeptidase [Gemmatimonadota bacterium]
MRSSVKVVALEQVRTPLLAVAVVELSRKKLPNSLVGLDTALDGELSRAVAAEDFSGKAEQTTLLYPSRGPKRVLLVGTGKVEEMSRATVRRCAAVAARRAVALNVPSLAFHIPAEARGGVTPTEVGQVVVEGAAQGAWQFTAFKGIEEGACSLAGVDIIVPRDLRPAAEKGRKVGAALASGQELARRLQATPGNVCTPTYLAGVARKLAKEHGFTVTVLGPTQISKEGLRALQAVASGSDQAARFITLKYNGAGRSAPLCFIGKGVTFDSGGISIKPSASMENMKYDMSGAASVLGLFEVLGRLKPKVNVVGLIPATENLPSGTAVKPGDVVQSHMGKFIEVVNTDAEGRLILCDALSYARRFKPATVIDIATLTGAIVVGLGHHAIGLLGNDDSLIEEVRWAGDLAGERCWPLPLWAEYRDSIKSDIADVKNSGGRAAGSITAGWFLREFVDGFPWAHLDIAGTAYIDGDRPDIAKGPTGIGVRLFAQFVLGRSTG